MQNEFKSEYSGLQELLSLEVLENYNNQIVLGCYKKFSNSNQIVDFGAGIGTLDLIFRDKYNIDPLCIEIDPTNISFLIERGFNHLKEIDLAPYNLDGIFSSNVLEHIKDDVLVLKKMKDHLKDKGLIYLYLPAQMILWTQLDDNVGHYRRYEIAELRKKCKEIGLSICKIQYADCLGWFTTLLFKLVNK